MIKILNWQVIIDYDGIFYDPVCQNDRQRENLMQSLLWPAALVEICVDALHIA